VYTLDNSRESREVFLMQAVKLRKVGNSMTVTLPAWVVESLHLRENDEIAVEVAGERIILTRATEDFQEAWEAYQSIEPLYRNANRKLAE
jgi:putative addiction module antidote